MVGAAAGVVADGGSWVARHDWNGQASREDRTAIDTTARDLVGLLLAVLGLLRDVMELQAIRRMEDGTLAAEEIERLGRTLVASRDALDDIATAFGITRETMSEALSRMIRLRDGDPGTQTETSEFGGTVGRASQ